MIDERAMSILNNPDITISVDQFAKICGGHIRNDYDCVVAVTSPWEGDGKSTFAIQFCRGIDKKFELLRNLLFSPTVTALQRMILGLPEFSAVSVDEAIKVMYKLKWSDKLNIYLNMLYALSRQEHQVSVCCMPRFKDFQEFFRNHKIKFWVHIIERGVAMISEKDWSQYCKDPWWIDENQQILDTNRKKRRFNEVDLYSKLQMYTKVRGFMCFVTWNDIDPEMRKEYDELKKINKYNDASISTTDNTERIEMFDTARNIADHLPDYVRNYRNMRKINIWKIMNKKHLSIRKSQQISALVQDFLSDNPTHPYHDYLIINRQKTENSDESDD